MSCLCFLQVSKTHANLEVLMVYREGACSILGPPLDPISLTLDPTGRCLVNVLFRPVQRVNVVSKETGAIEVAALMAILRLISGKGYLFCPGIPEKVLAGKVCTWLWLKMFTWIYTKNCLLYDFF